ncbi:MAG: peptidase T [Pyramidobacter sp.]|nr:peptidase T [Pyramidobacter sp.]
MSSAAERFIRYAKIPTQSKERGETVPSTPCQHDLAKVLGEELRALGLSDVVVDEHAYVYGTLPSNAGNDVPTIAFCAHIDTALEVTDVGNDPRIVENYDGGDVVLDAEENVVLSPSVFPELKNYVGNSLIVTNGKTLLGADDKAGIAEIVAALEYMIQHPEFKHGAVRVCFCPDEEVGHGASLWDLDRFGADFCYTVDGGAAGDFAYETFNAAQARITIKGRAVHPGKSKNTMINACLVAMDLASTFPPAETPAHTDNYEGFYHMTSVKGTCESAELSYIIRDHDSARFEARKEMVRTLVRQVNERWGAELATLEMHDQYHNMADLIRKEMHIVNTALKAIEMAGLKPHVHPVRGGTDGSQLSYRGLLTPNIFTGGHNAHGKYEYISIEAMEKAVEVILNIVNLYATGQEVR